MGLFRRRRVLERDSEALLQAAVDAIIRGDHTAGAGRWVIPRDALGIPAVFRAVDLIAGSVAGFQPISYRQGAPVADQPAILRAPDPFQTLHGWNYQAVTDLLTAGFCAWRRLALDPWGHPGSLMLLDPAEVQIAWDQARIHRVYTWRNVELVPGRDVTVVPFLTVAGLAQPIGPIQSLGTVLAGQAAADGLAASYFGDAALPSGALKTQAQLSRAKAEEYLADWEAKHQGRRRTAVLSGGLEFEAIDPLNGRDSQWLETRQWGAQEVCRAFGIPPHFLNTPTPGSSLTYQNVQQARVELLAFAIQPVLARLEAALTAETPQGQLVRYDTSEWQRADTAARIAAYATALGNQAWLTPEEVRQAETQDGGLLSSLAPAAASPPPLGVEPAEPVDQEVPA